jgi:membrane-bound ClpP family serine protease
LKKERNRSNRGMGANKGKAVEAIIALLDEVAFVTIIVLLTLYYLYKKLIISSETLIIILIIYILSILFLFYKIYRVQTRRSAIGPESMIGKRGLVAETLDPEGLIEIEGELWKAMTRSGERIEAGEKVVVIGHKGLTLIVERESKWRVNARA